MSAPFFRMVREEEEDGEGACFSCPEIERGVTLIYSAITMCGHVHGANKGMPRVCEYQGGDIQLERLVGARDALRARNQTQDDTPCKGCGFLRKKRWVEEKYPVRHITIGHYTPCNLECCYCYRNSYSEEERSRLNRPPYSAAEAFASLVRQDLLAPDSTAWLTGGEPTLYVDFEELMRLLLNHGVRTTVGTNGTRWSNAIGEGLRKDRVEVLCSVDSGTRQNYQEIKGRDEYESAWENLARYAACNPSNVVVKYILMEENAAEGELRAFARKCNACGVRRISISRDIRKYRGVLSSSPKDMPEQLLNAIVLLAGESIRHGIEVAFDVNWMVYTDAEMMAIKHLLRERLPDGVWLPDGLWTRESFRRGTEKTSPSPG